MTKSRNSIVSVLLLVVMIYALTSVAIAMTTADKCDGRVYAQKQWTYAPPHWTCGR